MISKEEKIEEVIEKNFGLDLKVRRYQSSDLVNKDNYLKYEYIKKGVILSVGSSEGEVKIGFFKNPKKLSKIIDLIVY